MQHDGTATTTHPGKGDGDPRLPLREKVGYGLGDFGFNLYWANISAFLLMLVLWFCVPTAGFFPGVIAAVVMVVAGTLLLREKKDAAAH